jgi:hypothetical protein
MPPPHPATLGGSACLHPILCRELLTIRRQRRQLGFPVELLPSDPDRKIVMVRWGFRETARSFSWSFPLPSLGRSGTHWLDEPTDVSSQNRPVWHLLDEGFSTRNRKGEGSSPSSGSKTAGQRVFLRMLTVRPRRPVIPLIGVRLAHPEPVDGPPSLAHDEQNSGGRTIGPALRAGRAFARIRRKPVCGSAAKPASPFGKFELSRWVAVGVCLAAVAAQPSIQVSGHIVERADTPSRASGSAPSAAPR